MPTQLVYDLLPDGCRWNLLNKIYMKTGYWPRTSDTSKTTYINFTETLSQQGIDEVNAIVGDGSTACDPVVFAAVDNKYIVKDIWEWKEQLETDVGFEIIITFRSSGTYGPNVYDEIVLQPSDPTYQVERVLTNPQKNALVNAVADLGSWE